MNFSYWEQKSWLENIDFAIVGSGIVGLNCALHLKEMHPTANIVVLEKGMLPQGASTKNAGFASFGSLSELIEDLEHHTEQEVVDIVKMRWSGLELLRKNLGDKAIDFQMHGGYELFTDKDLYIHCSVKNDMVNEMLKPIFKKEVFSFEENKFGFKNIVGNYSYNAFEGQIDTGKMMETLLQKVLKTGVKILNNVEVKNFADFGSGVAIQSNKFEIQAKKLFIATNGFTKNLLQDDIKPARAQVLITKPIKNLKIKGTFHLDRGYYYFRNIHDRILFGGGRNLDFKTEETTKFGQTEIIQNRLKDLLKDTILPNTDFEVDYAWSGIMGVGSQKKVLLKQHSNNIAYGVRLGGIGVAIGSLVGKELAELNS